MILQLQSETRWGSYGCAPDKLCEWLLSLEGDIDVFIHAPKPGVEFCGLLRKENERVIWLN